MARSAISSVHDKLAGSSVGSGPSLPPNSFIIDPAITTFNQKWNLDDPGFTNAYFDLGSNAWTASQMAAVMNAQAPNAPAPYTTTVWAGDDVLGVVYVVSGPLPSTLDSPSYPISIPLQP